MTRYVALLRGINVGRAKAISMSELSAVFVTLGFGAVRTVLRSGNVIFESTSERARAAVIESAVFEATGVQSSVLVVEGEAFIVIAAANPIAGLVTDGSKYFVTFAEVMPPALIAPDVDALAPEVLAIGPSAVYQWMPLGALSTRVPRSFWTQFTGPVTARNGNTVDRIVALLTT